MPKTIGVLGYGAIGKSFIDILLHNYPNANVVAVDVFDLPKQDRFRYIKNRVTKDNVKDLHKVMGLQSGDFLVDVSTNIEFLELWPSCFNNNIRYMNTALERWEENTDPQSYPKSPEQAYRGSLGYLRDQARSFPFWNEKKGPSSMLDHGMNPGLVSSFVKRGLEDAAAFYLKDTTATDIDRDALRKWLEQRNHSKLAQVLGLHTIHCSEWDNQRLNVKPSDLRSKFYNTWSCQGFLTEGMIPVQGGRGSHEDMQIKDFCVIQEGKTIMSFKPSTQTWANSWVPNQNIKGVLIPHGEAYSIREYLHDPDTGYAPSQYYVYDYNPYAKEYVFNLPADARLETVSPPTEVMHPMNYPDIRGVDKVGAFLIMKNNRGWWTGSVMDDVDCKQILNFKYGPTVLQVAGGVYSAFLWGCVNPNSGVRFPDWLDHDFLIKQALPYLGRFVSMGVDLRETSVKDCHKLQSFLCDQPAIP